MKYNLLFLSLVFFTACNNSNNSYELNLFDYNDRTIEDYNLRGFPKIVQRVTVNEIPEDLNAFNWAYNKNEFFGLAFDEEGRLIQSIKDGKKDEFQYNDDGQLTKSITHNIQEQKIIATYTYREDGKLDRIERNNNFKSTMSYDMEDNCTKITYLDRRNLHGYVIGVEYENFKYDDKGRIISDTYTDQYGSGEPTEIKYSRNVRTEKSGDILYETTFKGKKKKIYRNYNMSDGNKALMSESRYKYNLYEDEVSSKVKRVGIDEEPDEVHQSRYKYQYDKEGNWVVQSTYFNDKLSTIYIRKIEYHKKRYFGILP